MKNLLYNESTFPPGRAAEKGDSAMPTPWKRSPEELHKTYIANTEAF